MSTKLVPSNPADVMVIRDITPNVVTLSVPFARFGRFKVGGRGTLLKLTSGSLVVFSPVALTDAVRAKVASMGGKLGYIVAPDIEHHIFVSEWKAAYPDAKIIVPEGLPEKRANQKDPKVNPKDEIFAVFKAENKASIKITPEFDADIEHEYVDAHPSKEIVLFYKPDKVIVEADLLFNLPAKEQYLRMPEGQREATGFANRLFAALQSTEGDPTWPRRFMWHIMSRQNRTGWNESMQRIDKWDFVTVVPCHGDTMVGDGKDRFRKIFAWHL